VGSSFSQFKRQPRESDSAFRAYETQTGTSRDCVKSLSAGATKLVAATRATFGGYRRLAVFDGSRVLVDPTIRLDPMSMFLDRHGFSRESLTDTQKTQDKTEHFHFDSLD